MANWEAPHDPMPCHQGCDPRVDRGVGRAGSSKNVPGDQRLTMIARARCRLATSRRSLNTMVNLKDLGQLVCIPLRRGSRDRDLPSTTALVSKARPGNSTATLSAGLLGQSWSATR